MVLFQSNKKFLFLSVLFILLPVIVYAVLNRTNIFPRATQLPTAAVRINPGQIRTQPNGSAIHMSAQAVDSGGASVDGVRYQWGMSSTNSIGTIHQESNDKLATFIPSSHMGQGDLWVRAFDTSGHSVTGSIAVFVGTVPSVCSPLPPECQNDKWQDCVALMGVPEGGWCPPPILVSSCRGQPNGTACDVNNCPVCQPGHPCPLIYCQQQRGVCQRDTCVPIRPSPVPSPGCYYQQVQCIQAPCNPILVCPAPTCIPLPPCVFGVTDGQGNRVYCDPPQPPAGSRYCPRTTSTPTPTNTPTPTLSYYLQMYPSGNITTQIHQPNEGYALMALLNRNGSVVTNQSDFVYSWRIENPSVASLTPFSGCTNGIQPPCPLDHATIHATQSTPLTHVYVTVANKNNPNIWIASATFNLTVLSGSTPTPTPPSNASTIEFLIKFSGVTGGTAEGAGVTARFVRNDVNAITPPILFTHVGGGVYKAIVGLTGFNLPAGPGYTIILKGEKHVARKFCMQTGQTGPCVGNASMTIPSGTLTPIFDFTGLPLDPGDLPPQDGKADTADFDVIKSMLTKPCSALTAQDKKTADLDYNGCIDTSDAFLMRKTLETRYDEN